jgi:hypothetical protein
MRHTLGISQWRKLGDAPADSSAAYQWGKVSHKVDGSADGVTLAFQLVVLEGDMRNKDAG